MHPFQHDGYSILGDFKWPQEMSLFLYLLYEKLTSGFWCAWAWLFQSKRSGTASKNF